MSLSYHKPDTTLNVIRNSLKMNKALKRLAMNGGMIFSDNFLTEIKFKLTSLSIMQMEFQYQENFHAFLKTQKDSLEKICIGRWINFDVMDTILSMPRLKTAELSPNGIERKGNPILLPERLNSMQCFSQNLSVTCLHLKNTWITCFTPRLNRLFLKAFPNIEYLKITTLDDENAVVIAETCKNLRQLDVERFSVQNTGNEAFYLNLENFRGYKIEEDFQPLFEKLNGKKCIF